MRLRIAVVSAVAAAVLTAGGCGYSTKPTTGRGVTGATLQVIKATYMAQFKGAILTDQAGYALYIFRPDHDRQPTCYGQCARIWPPVYLGRNEQAKSGAGVKPSLLGHDRYNKIESVATYKGWPLYLYLHDTLPGAAAGQGINLNGGYWYVMRPDGTPIVPPGDPPAT